jgi:anti-sigma factor RsiW
MTCQEVIGLLGDYLEATLTPDTADRLDQHLEDCPACRAYLNTYRLTRHLVAGANRVEMPAELGARLRAFLLEHLRDASR